MDKIMDMKECMEKQFYNLMTDLNAIMKNIETYTNRFRIEGVAQNDIIYRNLLQKLVDMLSLLRRNDYFWFIFSAHKCIHASFLDAIGVLIRSKRTFGFQKQAICILMSTLNRSDHANHLSQFSIGSSSLATRGCWCVGIYNMFFNSVITPTELLFFLDFDNTEIDEPELVPVLLDYAMLFVKMLHADRSAWLITLDRFVDFFERFRLSSPLAANQLGSIKLAKMITLTIDILKGRISYINHELVSRILKRVKRSIVELFEERSNNGSNVNTNHDLHEMMKGLFHLISIYASHLHFERNPYSAIYFDMIDFYVELVRALIRNRFTEVSALLLDDLYVTLCMMFNNRMIRTEMLTARQLSIADLGVDILRNSQSFLSKHLMGSILDLGFRCINDSEVALDYIWNNGWHDIEPIWKRHFLASKPDGLNLASDLVCNFSFEIKRLEHLPLLKLFIDTSLDYLLAELEKDELTKAPHFFTQRALISIIDASSRLKQPVTFVKPLIDAYASLFKRFDITHWLVSFNNPLYFYVGLLEVRPVRKPCYLEKSEIWSPSFEFILDQLHKYNIEHIDVKSTSSHQLALFAIIEGLIWYYRKSLPANRKSQLLDFLYYIKKDSSEVHQVDIQRLIHSLNRIQCSEN